MQPLRIGDSKIGKNWLRSAMAISSDTLEYIWTEVHSRKCPEVKSAQKSQLKN